MSVPEATSCPCGGVRVPSARTDHWGAGENEVLYLHYLLKCDLCGGATEDERMRYLNAAGLAAARAQNG